MNRFKRQFIFSGLIAVVAFGAACSKKVMVPVPPRVDLESYNTIGMIEFLSNAEGDLPAYASQKFLQSMQSSQPGVRVLELGTRDKVLAAVGKSELDFEAIRAISEEYGVDAVMTGQFDVTDVKPNVDVFSMLQSMSVTADVQATMAARLYDAGGATVWTRSGKCAETVGHVGASSNGSFRFDASDPEEAYGKLVNELVYALTDDFRVHYARQ